ncbi:DNA polymerase III subunit gamma/tau [Shewanella sp. 202IG2-18]|uniref:DNA polymerase III subunit gamma/tau n=1 Tax=Parashewanella hymeniacidonis TaxID=2807618 RepID=UPI00195FBDBD|nr:DNA polymerase III subunit gamma/tau [Parashewanella hymeniacidonis]MBM7073338.1 DNA polymerase III subunit gamma/tau [Parashewanella hymeniacidonis]
MSYQVLARKWRPAKFEQVVGQSHVLHALTNALEQQRLHHAYLFTGTRGVGKTSLARLFAKGLNCETGVTASPCGKCSSCEEIAQGRFVDLIEVDAASRTKVDDTREILDNVQYRPTRGRYKVYLIDEVHMLSRSSFNALLKTLEEPPEHVKFLLATTDPQKLPITVLSRCLQFNLKALMQDDIAKQLNYVLEQEQLKFESSALTLLAKAANGSMRDALSLTDQAIAFGAGQVMLEQVQTMLGSIDEQHVIGLLSALCSGDIATLIPECHKVIGFGAEPEEVLRSLLELLHQITLTQFASAAAQLSKFAEQIHAFSEQLTPEQVQLYYQILLTGRKELPFAPDPKSGLEMALLRAVAFVPQTSIEKWETPAAEKKTLEIPAIENEPVVEQESVAHQVDEQAASQEPEALAEETNVELKPEAEETDLKQENLQALEAEQAVLMSQAQSQGFVATPIDDSQPPLSSYDVPYETSSEADGFDFVASDSNRPSNDKLTSDLVVENKVKPSKAEALQVDDLLDAVLSSNQGLLSDISNFENDVDKADSPKKSKATFERRLPVKEDSSSELEQDVLEVAEVNSNGLEAEVAEVKDDTPPWEEKTTPIVLPEVAESVVNVEIQPATEQTKPVEPPQSLSQAEKQLPSVISGNQVDLYWYKLMSELDFGGRVRQLAVNSICNEISEPIHLLLKPDQKHLAADIAVEQLEAVIEKRFDRPIDVQVEIGIDKERETPLEIRQRFQNELHNEAEHKLLADPNVQWLSEQLGARLITDTIAYPPSNLVDRAKRIEDIEFSVPA